MGVTTTVLLTQATQSPGLITTPSFTIAQQNPVPIFEAFATMNAVDIADVTLVIPFALQILNTSSGVWETVVSTLWKGNATVDKQGNVGQTPHVSWNATSDHGVACRVVLTLPRSVSIGISGRTTT